MKGVKTEVLADVSAKTERKPRKEHMRRLQNVTAVVAARSLKATVALLVEDFPEVAGFKRKNDLLNYLYHHEEAAHALSQKLQ